MKMKPLTNRSITRRSSTLRKVAFIGTYVPRSCGIATFTRDLSDGVAGRCGGTGCTALAITVDGDRDEYPPRVGFRVAESQPSSYRRAADYLNASDADVVSLQHEFGIFGGPDGGHILTLLRRLRLPVVTTMHTVVRDPSESLRKTTLELVGRSDRIVVMAERGREFLSEIYHADPDKIDVIPHGIPDVPFTGTTRPKAKLGIDSGMMMLTFGLLSPNKGIERVIRALPEVVKAHPDLVYVVLGATHPNLVRREGERYRESLQELADSLGVRENVVFHDSFVTLEKLKQYIAAADIYVTPYLNEAQITSGTLAYAVGAGKPVVSTPYWHAQELLADGRGVLVPFGDSDALASELTSLAGDDIRRHDIRRAAYRAGREMVWARVAERHLDSLNRALNPRALLGSTPELPLPQAG